MKKILAFYDLLLYAIICLPLILIALISLITLVTYGTHEWLTEKWYVVPIFAISLMLPIGGVFTLRYCTINNDSVYFHYFTFATGWKKASNNIDISWNQDAFIPEIGFIEIVNLSETEKETKIYYKHWFNKYLKITLKNGSEKYVYVGNYSNSQIKKILGFINPCAHK